MLKLLQNIKITKVQVLHKRRLEIRNFSATFFGDLTILMYRVFEKCTVTFSQSISNTLYVTVKIFVSLK